MCELIVRSDVASKQVGGYVPAEIFKHAGKSVRIIGGRVLIGYCETSIVDKEGTAVTVRHPRLELKFDGGLGRLVPQGAFKIEGIDVATFLRLCELAKVDLRRVDVVGRTCAVDRGPGKKAVARPMNFHDFLGLAPAPSAVASA